MNNEITNLVAMIKSKSGCNNCGGTILNGVCEFCDTIYEEFNVAVQELCSKLDKIDISMVNQMSDVMNDIYMLKDMRIEKIDSFLLKTKYEDIIKKEYHELFQRINSGTELNSEDCKKFEYFMFNYDTEENKINYCDYVIRAILLGKGQFSYEFVKKIITCFTEKAAEFFGLKCKAAIEELKEHVNGEKSGNRILLNNNLIDNFYYNHNPKLIETIFHEVSHIMQDKRQKNKSVVSLPDYLQIKDMVASRVNSDFYDDNYLSVTFENEARLNGAIYSMRYLKALFGYQGSIEKEELERINLTIAQNENMLRAYRGNDANVEDIFDEIISSNPKYLIAYPSLRYEYKETEDGHVVRKSFEEIKDEYFTNDFSNLDKNSYNALMELYMYIMKKAKNKEINMSY